jgi:hypothetical protein
MSNYLAERINKSRFLRTKKGNEIDFKYKYVIGFDSEADTTSDGRPMLFQFSLPDTTEEQVITHVVPPTKHAGLGVFLDFIDYYCRVPEVEYLIYVWNLTYEMTQLFHDLPSDIRNKSEFTIRNISRGFSKKYHWSAEVFNYKRQIIVFRKRRIKVTVVDGTAFYKIKLDSAAKMLGLGEKYELSALSRELFTRDDLDDADFLRYARRDAYITRRIGEYIQHQHYQYSIPTTLSAPHFAATVFKTHFLKDQISVPPKPLEQAGLYSYHGGKNGFYLDGPMDFPDIYQYDITSAYPEAMRQLPDIETSEWTPTGKYVANQHALYQVTMEYSSCTYRGMQNHEGPWTNSGLVIDQWITGYELDEIIRQGEGRLIRCTGFLLHGNSGGALSEFVDRFFAIKRNSTGPERETAKLLLNSLYGKFFQKQPIGIVGTFDLDELRWVQSDPDQSFDYEAGGLYNPPIASLITGFVRAKIHRLEHKYESVMTSTDGLFGLVTPDYGDVGKDLGQLTVTRGRLRIWRERLYIFDGNDDKRKFALHGFHAGTKELETIPLARGEYHYLGKQMITLKMSTREQRKSRYSPGQFVLLDYVLRI